jgi:hypothetical protein
MASWLADQWKQVRGHVKYEVLRAAVLAVTGSGIIAAGGEMLHKRFQGVDSEWFVFGAIFCCSLLVFVVSLLRLASKPSHDEGQPSNRLDIDTFSETMQLGAIWIVPTTI